MKIKLYLDFDGVILDTTNTLEKMMINRGLGIDAWSDPDDEHFFFDLNWKEIIEKSKPINDSIINIQKIIDSNLYDVSVLTHVNSDEEGKDKQRYLNQYFENLKVIPVLYPTPKCEVVDCKNAILVDDYTGNLAVWKENGGISIKFSVKQKQYDYKVINRLDSLIEDYEEILRLTNS